MNRLKKFLTDTADSLLRVALRYPVEAALCIYACIFGAIQIEWSFDFHMLAADGAATEMRQLPDGIFTMLPLTMLATLVVHARRPGLAGMAHALPAGTAAADDRLVAAGQGVVRNEPVLHHLGRSRATPDCSWPAAPLPNGPFVRQTLGYIRAAVVGGIFALTAMLLRDGHLPLGHLHLQYPGVMGSP